MPVAVLGGTISGTTAARKLALSGIQVDLFRNLNDPKRSISNVHPICEYQTATFVLRDNASPEFAAEVKSWLDRGLLEDASQFWFGHMDAKGNAREAQTPGRRFLPKGGFFSLLDSLMADLPTLVQVKVEQLVRMSRDAGKWQLTDRHGAVFGPYDAVICAFDALPRAARKASEKQLLETALPHSSAVIASAARAQMCSCMTIILHVDPPLEVPYDSILFDDVPELQFAARNPKEHQTHRGIHEKYDTWTVVATPAWSLSQRPDSKGTWDKRRVGRDIADAFCRAMNCNPRRGRQIIPTFHWEGCSYITQVQQGDPCAFDSDVGLGWCGDMYGGLGPAGAFTSGLAASSLVAHFVAGNHKSVLPGETEWVLRQAQEGDEDIVSVVGPTTGRREPSDGLDHTWDTTVRLARGADVQAADSYKRFRKCGPLGEKRYRQEEGPWAAPSSKMSAVGKNRNAVPRLHCSKIDDGILKLTGLPPDVQSRLLRSVFSVGAQGVCGGLYDARRGTIDAGHGTTWSVCKGSEVSWSELGLHGRHTVQLERLGGTIVEEVLHAVKEAAPEVLRDFHPDSVRVAFENMRGRTIRPGQTLCGWSRDRDRIRGNEDHPKVCIVAGSSRIWHGYKYRKEDRESLDVELCPGDVLVVYGPGRAWFSAVNGFELEKSTEEKAPFDFTHIWFQDHRCLQQLHPEVYDSIHHPPTPTVGSPEYKWMQFEYTVVGQRSADDELLVRISDGDLNKREHADIPERSQKVQTPSKGGRRWASKIASRVDKFEGHSSKIAGA